MKERSAEETSASLRKFAEDQLEIRDNIFSDRKNYVNTKLDDLYRLDVRINDYAKMIDNDFVGLKNYFEE